jgi:hypothetical protein
VASVWPLREAAVTACWLHVALHAKEIGRARADTPLDLVRRGGVDAHTELRWLREIVDAWHSPSSTTAAACGRPPTGFDLNAVRLVLAGTVG